MFVVCVIDATGTKCCAAAVLCCCYSQRQQHSSSRVTPLPAGTGRICCAMLMLPLVSHQHTMILKLSTLNSRVVFPHQLPGRIIPRGPIRGTAAVRHVRPVDQDCFVDLRSRKGTITCVKSSSLLTTCLSLASSHRHC